MRSAEGRRRAATKQRVAQRRRRDEIHALLGGVCVHCGFADPRALQVDHIHGDGREDRGEGASSTYYQRILLSLRSGQTGKYQLLCANCNWIKRVENGEHAGGPNSEAV